MYTDRRYPYEEDEFGGGNLWNGDAYKEKIKKKPEQQIAELLTHVQLLTKQLEQQETDYARKLKDLQTSFQSMRLEQSQISDRLAKFQRQGLELKKHQEDFNRDVNGTLEKVRREIVADQESMAKLSREVKNRLDSLDVDKALTLERLKHLREDLSKERAGKGGDGGGLMVHERESTVQRMEIELKRLQVESSQQGKLLIGTACGAVVIVAYLLAARL